MPGYQVEFQRIGAAGGADLHIRSLLDRRQCAGPPGEAHAAGVSSADWPLSGQIWRLAQRRADPMQECDSAARRVLGIGCGLGQSLLDAPLLDRSSYRGRLLHHWRLPQ